MEINKGVPIHQGAYLAIEQRDAELLGIVALTKPGNKLSQVYEGPLATALAKAKQASTEAGLEGYYEISGVDELSDIKPKLLGGLLEEIDKQVGEAMPKTGYSWGPVPNWAAEQLHAMPAAQAQVSRLGGLRDILIKRLSPAL